MNWKLIVQLSLFGLIMAFGTISLIPDKIEPFFWLVIFAFCAFVIARACTGKYFMHGFWVSIFNCVWITTVHFIFFTTYAQNHPDMVIHWHPRLAMVLMGPVVGIVCGLILGLFALIASKLVKPNASVR
ncbi:hypothetical protein BEL04_19185 [Mucilaginibacter sp. PPCGB 2223]|uniref:hypothetical protein n=1 Tax=Mucilaginibacter sp. PPCGB 2223 TaxID=1886027 RepID=UPI000826B789|nr:hypothetical protein [Mucilaginibacter sp. PPCGB 2223]OCX50853.1 hypothetical protein BEL04_19185 [Mucilaginibacter sp. PPCGB 2223]